MTGHYMILAIGERAAPNLPLDPVRGFLELGHPFGEVVHLVSYTQQRVVERDDCFAKVQDVHSNRVGSEVVRKSVSAHNCGTTVFLGLNHRKQLPRRTHGGIVSRPVNNVNRRQAA